MLAIRLQRLGRKGYATYRLAVQEAQRHPTSGRVVTYVGNYNPHTKQVTVDKDKVLKYLNNGAQPSPRVVRLLQQEKIALPSWVQKTTKKDKKIRHPEKLRANQPKQESQESGVESQAEQTTAKAEDEDTAAPVEEAVADTAEAPAEQSEKK